MRSLNLLLLLLLFSGAAFGQMTNDDVSTPEDTPVTFNVATNDNVLLPDPSTVDLNTTLLGVQTSMTTAEGTYEVVSLAGDVTFTPLANFNGTSTLEYSMNYFGILTGTANINMTITAVPDPPVAVDNLGQSTNEDTPVTFSVTANDTDPDGDLNPASVVISGETNGTFVADGLGQVTYTPPLNFNGTATASYTVSDLSGLISNSASISVSVASVNDLPVAVDDLNKTTAENVPVTFSVVTNDTDIDGTINPATVIITNETNGSYVADAAGNVTYTPTPGYSGPATANYTVSDNQGGISNVASISIVVSSVNDPPVAVNDTGSMSEDATPITISILANDSDPDGTIDPSSVVLSAQVNGTFSVSATGILTYSPPLNFNGIATVKYTVQDNLGLASNSATVTITVSSVNDAPVAGALSASTSENTAVTFSGIGNASDIDGTIDPASVVITSPTNGTFVPNAAGNITYTPTPGFNGTATASYTVKDNNGLISNVSTISVSVSSVNDAPVAVNDAASMSEDTAPITINILANDSDPDGTINPATVILTSPVNGVFTVSTTGVVTYTPALNFNGVATVKYTVKDNDGLVSNEATVTVTVNAINDAPVASPVTASTPESTAVTFNVSGSATDLDGTIDPASIAVTAGTHGTFTPNANGTVTFTPTAGYNGTATANYTIKDNLGLISNVSTITINVSSVNDAPVAVNDVASMTEDGAPIAITILANDSDPDGTINPATVALSTPTNGTFTVAATGIVTYTPPANFNGTATVKYTVKDDDGLISNVATVTVTVTPQNDPPSFADIPNQRVLKNSANTAITVTGITAGAGESETMTITASSGNTVLMDNPVVTYNGTGTTATLTFKPKPNVSGTVTITVKVKDGVNEVSKPFDVEIVNVEFISTPVTLAVPDQLYEYFIEITDVTETLTIIATQKPAWAAVTSISKNKAKLSGTPPANAPLNTQVTLQLKDGSTVLDDQVFTIIVNRPPLITSFSLQTTEDTPIAFTAENFQTHYTDPDSQPLAEIQFTKLPANGVLKLNGNAINAGDKVPIASITSVTYAPGADYNGNDVISWKASDGFSFSQAETTINYLITPVNDAPVIESLETTALQYELGSEVPVKISQTAHIYDVDDTNLTGAEIGIRFLSYQVDKEFLIYKDTLGIIGNFNAAAGILVLTGTAPVKDYETAIRTIKFNFVNLEEVKPGLTEIYYNLTDGKNTSDSKTRMIELIYTFKDLFIPTAFTPGGNDVNETWVITSPNTTDGSVPFDDANIRVFTKSGIMVFETTGFDNPWDGTFAGKELPVDTYYYTIDLKYNKIRYRGVVTILR